MNSNGVGLGLYICRQIVNQFGGNICVRSRVGEGSTFYFNFEIENANIQAAQRLESFEASVEEEIC